MSKKAPTKLPDKPSALIRLALKDLEKCERSRKYKIDMDYWYKPNGKCKVCLAGSVMAQTMQIKSKVEIEPCFLDDDSDRLKLEALNNFRVGYPRYALEDMGIRSPAVDNVPWEFSVEDYGIDPTQFKRDMRKLASLLAKEGL